jgi:hypothetical protein
LVKKLWPFMAVHKNYCERNNSYVSKCPNFIESLKAGDSGCAVCDQTALAVLDSCREASDNPPVSPTSSGA